MRGLGFVILNMDTFCEKQCTIFRTQDIAPFQIPYSLPLQQYSKDSSISETFSDGASDSAAMTDRPPDALMRTAKTVSN